MPRKEKLNEDYLIKRVKETRGQTRKVGWLGRRGAPDRFCGWTHLGTNAFVEVKEEGQPWGLQDHQAREIQFLRHCGIHCTVLSNKDEIDAFIYLKTGERNAQA